jgi:hypothetical protein
MLAFREPTILSGSTPLNGNPFSAMWVNVSFGKEAHGAAAARFSRQVNRVASVASFHPQLFSKMLAKIGHSFAVAEAAGRFRPILSNAIIGREPWLGGYLVGGDTLEVPPSEYQTEVGLRRVNSATGQEYLMARIRLFGDLGAPVYYVVVGELDAASTDRTQAGTGGQAPLVFADG